MSEEYQRIELITGTARRRHWSTEQKLRIIEESFRARRDGVFGRPALSDTQGKRLHAALT